MNHHYHHNLKKIPRKQFKLVKVKEKQYFLKEKLDLFFSRFFKAILAER